MALDLKINLYLDNAGENLYFEDGTGGYSVGNTGGYGPPNENSSDFTAATITVGMFGTNIIYTFNMVAGVITVATVEVQGNTPINILPDLLSTSWPFTDLNPFNLTPFYWDSSLPALEDQDYTVLYSIDSSSASYSASGNYLVTTDVCCCVSKQMLTVNINNREALVDSLIPSAFLAVAGYASCDGLVDKSNIYLSKAAALCEKQSGCGCGC